MPTICATVSSYESRSLVVADLGVVCSEPGDELQLFRVHFLAYCCQRLPENLLCDRKPSPLPSCEITLDERLICTTKVVDVIGHVLANVDFSVGVRDLVNHLDRPFRVLTHFISSLPQR